MTNIYKSSSMEQVEAEQIIFKKLKVSQIAISIQIYTTLFCTKKDNNSPITLQKKNHPQLILADGYILFRINFLFSFEPRL